MTMVSIENAILTGGQSDNEIDTIGFTGNALLAGGDGNDTFKAGRGSDVIFGGLGIDTLERDLTGLPSGAAVTLQNNSLLVEWQETIMVMMMPVVVNVAELDLFNSIETVTLTGTPNSDSFDVSGWTTSGLTVHGGAGIDIIQVIQGAAGGSVTLTDSSITFTGGPGSIAISTMEQAILTGGDSDDVLDASGFSGAVGLLGGAGNDTLRGGRNGGILDGGIGDDLFVFQSAAMLDTFFVIGGDGEDTLDFSSFAAGVTVNLSTVGATQVVAAGDLQIRLVNEDVEGVMGGSGADVLTGNSLANRFTGGPGADTINGNSGTDRIVEVRDVALMTLTNASLTIGGEVDTLTSIERAELTGGAGNNTIDASAFTNPTTLTGGDGLDILRGGTSTDVLIGGAGNDILEGGNGGDRYLFDVDLVLGDDTVTELVGGGADILDFSMTETVSLTVNLSLTTLQPVHATNLRLTLTNADTVDHIIGGAQADTLTGNGLDNFFLGGAGSDVINGLGGTDVVFEIRDADFILTNTSLAIDPVLIGAPNETDTLSNVESAFLTGGESNNIMDASAFTLGSVTLGGGDGDDTLTGGSGDDSLNGGNGNDLMQGSDGDDSLGGDAGNDMLYGGIGDDTLNGDDGNDTLHGGGYDPVLPGLTDDDQLTGGRGNDTYVFDRSLQLGADTLTELPNPPGSEQGYYDVILGLGLGGLDIDLSDTTQQDFLGEIDDMGTLGVVLELTLAFADTVEDAF
jgi:Ca2+-binding RTX toxin-like protein